MSVWNIPVDDLPWYHKLYMKPLVMGMKGLNYGLKKISKLLN
ncbi:MAG: hypothetical protein ACOCTM_03170 [Bacteroidota bacterium]